MEYRRPAFPEVWGGESRLIISYSPEDAIQYISQDISSITVSVAAVKTVLISSLESLLVIVPVIRLADISFVTLVAGHVHAVTSVVQAPAAIAVLSARPIAIYISAANCFAK